MFHSPADWVEIEQVVKVRMGVFAVAMLLVVFTWFWLAAFSVFHHYGH